jgi:hypothetical protein
MKLDDDKTNQTDKKDCNSSDGSKKYYATSSSCTETCKIPSKQDKSVENYDTRYNIDNNNDSIGSNDNYNDNHKAGNNDFNNNTPKNRDDDTNLVSTDDTNCRRSVRSRTVLTNPDFEYDYDDHEGDCKKNSNKKKKIDITHRK